MLTNLNRIFSKLMKVIVLWNLYLKKTLLINFFSRQITVSCLGGFEQTTSEL